MEEGGLALGVTLVDTVAVLCAVDAVQCGVKQKLTSLVLILAQVHVVAKGRVGVITIGCIVTPLWTVILLLACSCGVVAL